MEYSWPGQSLPIRFQTSDLDGQAPSPPLPPPLQVQYHAAKKGSASSPRVEGLLRDLERDVERRERFLRECARMVGAFPELEEEVRKIYHGPT